MFELLQKLYKIRLLSPLGLFYFSRGVLSEGVNLMTLLFFAARTHGAKTVLEDENESISYQQLFSEAQRLAAVLKANYNLQPKQKIAFLCRNNISLIRALFAVSRLGADVYLLNPEVSAAQFALLVKRHKFNFYIYDSEVLHLIESSDLRDKSLVTYHAELPSVDGLSKTQTAPTAKIKKAFSSNITVLTGGTTGEPKIARRRASVFNFLNPFFALIVKLNLDAYERVFVATPVYHGFGVAAIFIGLTLGYKMFLVSRFDAKKSCELIERHKVEVVTLVPLMLQRMLNQDAAALKSLARIISGGAPLNPALVEEFFNRHLGEDKLFNLYGTSEAGFSVMATPDDLRRSSNTIGKKIWGVNLKILDDENKEVPAGKVGRICIKSRWTISENSGDWVETGDLGYMDEAGCYFLCGRIDEMIVSGGENVYPIELENVLVKHPDVRQAAVIGVSDQEFGQRLKAFVVPVDGKTIDQAQILEWLTTRVARYQMPVNIAFMEDLPVTSIGKINKKALS